jgi:hypothetical protein
MSTTHDVLRDDAAALREGMLEVRIGLPWIRSLPVSCLTDLEVRVNSRTVPVRIRLGDDEWDPHSLGDDGRWWYLQDRIVLVMDAVPTDVALVQVSFRLLIPYLGTPDGPLLLPFEAERELVVHDGPTELSVSRDVA